MSKDEWDYQQITFFLADAINELSDIKSKIRAQKRNNRYANELAFLALARTSLIISNCFTRVSYQLLQSGDKKNEQTK